MIGQPPREHGPPPAETGAAALGPGAPLGEAAFACIAAIARREAGLALPAGKAAMVRTRLARRLRALALPGFDAYCALLQGPEGSAELPAMISALTTNVSQFFRENHHFELLRDTVLPALEPRIRAGHRIRFWSAGCSNGQEPYSIAMSIRDAGLPGPADVRILATDIDSHVIAHARAGFYPAEMTAGLTDALRDRHFSPATRDGRTGHVASEALRAMISFRELNLLADWPMRGRFDAIFCRNVVIYFDEPTQDALWQRFASALEPGGWLFIGHSERVPPGRLDLFQKSGVTAYRRVGTPEPARAVRAPGG